MVRRFGAALAIATMIVGWFGATAHAERPDAGTSTVSVGPMASGSVVTQGTAGYGPPGTQATADTQANQAQTPLPVASGGSDYTYRPVPDNQLPVVPPLVANSAGTIIAPQGGTQSACPPGQIGYLVYGSGGNTSFGIICVPSGQPAASPEVLLAQQASSKQPWPNLVLDVNPVTGLAGLASWFWLSGGSASMSDATASSGPLTVTVHASLIGASWDFGDGGRSDSGDLGQPYPAGSDVQHVYQTDTYGLPGGYNISGLLRFLVTFSVNGGPWQQLGVKAKAYSRTYAVFQIQPVAVGG